MNRSSTVVQLSPDAQKVFNYDPDRLSKMASLFVKYAPIPEFGHYALLVIDTVFIVLLFSTNLYIIRKKVPDYNNFYYAVRRYEASHTVIVDKHRTIWKKYDVILFDDRLYITDTNNHIIRVYETSTNVMKTLEISI